VIAIWHQQGQEFFWRTVSAVPFFVGVARGVPTLVFVLPVVNVDDIVQ